MNELYHHGIKGMKWGIRRYQNADGSLTEEGKKRYDHYTSVAEERLRNRDTYYSKRADRDATGLTEYTVRRAARANKINDQMRKHSQYILENPDRTIAFGRRTVRQRMNATVGQIAGYSVAGAATVATILGGPVGVLAVSALGAGVGVGSTVAKYRTKR